MIRNIAILVANDLAVAFRNKTLCLVLFVPIFVFSVLILVDGEGASKTLRIGLLENRDYPADLLHGLQSAGQAFAISWLPDEGEGRRWLKGKKGDGVLVPLESEPRVAVLVTERTSPRTIAMVEGLTEVQRALEDGRHNWVSEIRVLYAGGIERQMAPTWILMLILLVGFIVLPMQVAEEKEKRLVLGLMQTPLGEAEWLTAKICLGMILIALAALLFHLMAGWAFDLGVGPAYIAFIVAGGFCFSAFGILVGSLCRTQASARTLGVICYLPHLLPSSLSDFSQTLSMAAPFFLSHEFYVPTRSILLEGMALSDFQPQWVALIAAGMLAALLSLRLIKKRWLMG